MSKLSKLILFIFLFLSSTNIALAQNIETTIEENPINTHNDIYFEANDIIEIKGKKFGDDVYLIGNNVLLDGIINGDVLIIANEGEINGIIEQDLRIVGGNLTINAQVLGNVAIVANQVEIGEKAIFYKNLSIASMDTFIDGQVLGKTKISSYQAQINTKVDDNWEVKTNNLILGEKFSNLGNLTYYSPIEITNSSASANLKWVEAEFFGNAFWEKWERMAEYLSFFTRLGMTINALFILAIGYWAMRKFPDKFLELTKIDLIQSKKLMKKGARIWLLLIVTTIILVSSILGMGPGIILASILITLSFYSNIMVCFIVGRLLLIKMGVGERRGFALLAGIVFNLMMFLVPIIGPIYNIMVLSLGIGIIWESE